MKNTLNKTCREKLFIALFLVFVCVFSFFRSQVADIATWMLAMTHEVSLASGDNGSSGGTIKITASPKIVSSVGVKTAAPSTTAATDYFKKPVTAALPKTETPVISFTQELPEWEKIRMPEFPPLRKYDGTAWNKEKTELKFTTDGKRLYLICRLYDKNPEQAITRHSEKNGSKSAWQDDSIEILLMKDSKSTHYCQYIVSVSGAGCVFYYKNGELPNRATNIGTPSGFESPRVDVNKLKGGFEIEMRIALSNIGVSSLAPGDTLLMQLVRNYRGQGENNSVILQLFPVYIYADKRLGASNHDRRAFGKIQVKPVK